MYLRAAHALQSLVAKRQPLSRGFCGPDHNGACSLRGKVEAGAPLPPDQEFRRVLANAGCKDSAAGTMANRSLFASETGNPTVANWSRHRDRRLAAF